MSSLNPRGRLRMAVGLPNSPEAELALVEPEGMFSPGAASYGIYLWWFDPETASLLAPSLNPAHFRFGLTDGRIPIPWARLNTGGFELRTEVANVFDKGALTNIAAARAQARNENRRTARISLFAAIRPIGPSGGPLKSLEADRESILVNGRLALLANTPPTQIGLSQTDNAAELALRGLMPDGATAASPDGRCSGMMRFDLTLRAGETRTIGFVCPLRATNPHSELAESALRKTTAERVFRDAAQLWKDYSGKFRVTTPDARWGESMSAILAHSAIAGIHPDTPPAFINLFQKTGQLVVSERLVTSALAAGTDPAGLLWILAEQWLISRDFDWLRKIYPSATKLAGLLSASPEPETARVAGLRYAALLAEAFGQDADVRAWKAAAQRLFDKYEIRFQSNLKDKDVLWPWRLYPATWGPAFQQLKEIGRQGPAANSVPPLALAHQALMAGSRKAAFETLNAHLDLETMRDWYLLEPGKPAPSAEFWHLMRDSLLHEDDDRLVLFSGIPEDWFQSAQPIRIEGAHTHYGASTISYTYNAATRTGDLRMEGSPPRGHLLRIPKGRPCRVYAAAEPLPFDLSGDCEMPRGIWRARVVFT